MYVVRQHYNTAGSQVHTSAEYETHEHFLVALKDPGKAGAKSTWSSCSCGPAGGGSKADRALTATQSRHKRFNLELNGLTMLESFQYAGCIHSFEV